jgi:hypothetical protein
LGQTVLSCWMSSNQKTPARTVRFSGGWSRFYVEKTVLEHTRYHWCRALVWTQVADKRQAKNTVLSVLEKMQNCIELRKFSVVVTLSGWKRSMPMDTQQMDMNNLSWLPKNKVYKRTNLNFCDTVSIFIGISRRTAHDISWSCSAVWDPG